MLNSVLDQIADISGAELVRLCSFCSPPDFVKSASIQGKHLFDPPTDEKIARNIYADVEHRLYPCHNPASTWLSALFFQDKRAEYTRKFGADCARLTELRLNELARTYRIKDAVAAIASSHATMNKPASVVDTDWAIVKTEADGQVYRDLRLANPQEIKAAGAYLLEHHNAIPAEDRLMAAQRVLEKAAAAAIDMGELTEPLQRMAGQGICDPADVVQFFRIRQKLASSTLQAVEIGKLADAIAANPEMTLTPQRLPELLKAAEEIDTKLHLRGNYTDVIKAPEDVLFSVTYGSVKSALDNSIALLSGGVYDKQAMAKLPLSQFRDVFGDDLAREITSSGLDIDPVKLAEVAPTLPLPDARLLERLCTDNGISRVHSAKQANLTPGQQVGLTRQEAEQLAAVY